MNRFSRASFPLLIAGVVALGVSVTPANAVAPHVMMRPRAAFMAPSFIPITPVRPTGATSSFPNPTVVFINPFQRQVVVPFNGNPQVASVNPFAATTFTPLFPNARLVFDPFRVPIQSFQANFPGGASLAPSTVFNPTFHSHGWGMSPFWGMSGSGMGLYGGNSGAGYGSSGYGNQGYGSGGGGQSYNEDQVEQDFQATHARYANGGIQESARLNWPVGLKVLPPTAETDQLRQQLEAELLALASQPNTNVAALGSAQVARLRQLLNESEHKLARTSINEARQFLDRLEASLSLAAQMRTGNGTAMQTGGSAAAGRGGRGY